MLIALVLAVLTLPLLQAPASAAPTNGIDIDGDRSGDDDWEALVDGAPGYKSYVDVFATGKIGNVPAVDDDVFQSAREAEAPSGWQKRMGGTDSGNDIGRTYSFNTVDAAGNVFFYLGFARKENGVGAFAVELNKLANDSNGMPLRSQGDVRITFGQDSGNVPLTQFGADIWNTTTMQWDNIALSATNHASAAGENGLFAELEINLTAAGLQPPCGAGFNQVNLRSRSSAAPSSLKDYVEALDVLIAARCKSITVEKLDDTAGGAPLAGAEFQLFADTTADGALNSGDLQVGPLGSEQAADVGAGGNTYTWDDLTWGRYFVKESTLPAGYESDPGAPGDVREVLLDGNQPGDTEVVTFSNPRQTAQIRVEKFSFETPRIPLSGATFRLYEDNNGDGDIDDDDQAIGGEVDADQGADGNTFTWPNQLAWGDYLVKEIEAPDGYTSDPASAAGSKPVTIERTDAGSVVSVEFNNVRKPITTDPESTIVVTKTDADAAGVTVDGAGFALYLDDGDGLAEAGELVDDSPDRTGVGTYEWVSLPSGAYLVQEATPPAGYLPPAQDTQPVTATGGTYNVGFANAQKKSVIVLTKTDAVSGAQIDGATFVLERNDVVVTAAPVHAAGTGLYTWSDLPMGDYAVTETNPPLGYLAPDADSLPADAVESVDIDRANAGQTFQLGFENEAKATTGPPPPPPPPPTSTEGSIRVTKLDADDGRHVDGATFEAYLDVNSSGAVDSGDRNQGAPTRTGTGSYVWMHLPAGEYVVKEARAPSGYLPPTSDTQALTLAAGATSSVEFHNSPKRTGIQVTKRDAKTNRPLDTASFQLWDDADADGAFDGALDTRVGNPKNTVQGVVSWVGLRMGTYFVQETAAPEGYHLLANAVMTLVIDGTKAGGNLERSFYDRAKKSTIKVVKRDDATHEVLSGATFRAYLDVDRDGRVGDVDLPVGGARVTNRLGVTSWSGLGFGRYVIEEVSPPPGYGLAHDSTRSVRFDRANAGATVRRVFLDPALGTITIEKTAHEQQASGVWTASDGEVGFGVAVKYLITAKAEGAKVYRDVRVTDFIPGYDPADHKSTTDATYVAGSATCEGDCAVSFDQGNQQLTWSLGDLRREKVTLEFVVRTAPLPHDQVFNEDGELTETLVNVAQLSWRERTSPSGQRLTSALAARGIRSNEVVTTLAERVEVLNAPPSAQPTPVKNTPQGLPETGASANSDLIVSVAGLSLLLGVWLMLVGRGRGFHPQR